MQLNGQDPNQYYAQHNGYPRTTGYWWPVAPWAACQRSPNRRLCAIQDLSTDIRERCNDKSTLIRLDSISPRRDQLVFKFFDFSVPFHALGSNAAFFRVAFVPNQTSSPPRHRSLSLLSSYLGRLFWVWGLSLRQNGLMFCIEGAIWVYVYDSQPITVQCFFIYDFFFLLSFCLPVEVQICVTSRDTAICDDFTNVDGTRQVWHDAGNLKLTVWTWYRS